MEQYEKSPSFGDLGLRKDVGGAIATQVNNINSSLDLQAKKITICIDKFNYTRKPDSQEVGKIVNRIIGTQNDYTLQEVAQKILCGATVTLSEFEANKNPTGNTFIRQYLLIADIDNERNATLSTVEDCLKICNAKNLKPFLIYFTFSHSSEKPKFRLVFVLDVPIENKEQAEKASKALVSLFSQADPACTNVNRLVYGTSHKEPCYLDYNARITAEHLLALYEEANKPTTQQTSFTKKPDNGYDLQREIQNFDFLNFILTENPQCTPRGSKEIKINPCPICGHKDCFSLNIEKNTYVCFSANGQQGKGGTVIDYLMYTRHIDQKEAVKVFLYDILKKPKIKLARRTETTPKVAREYFTIESCAAILEEMKIAIKYNEINKKLDFRNTETGVFIDDMTLEHIATYIHSKFSSLYKNCNFTTIERYLGLIISQNRYNPVLDIIDKAVYDGSNQLGLIYKALHIEDDPLSKILVKKWIWQALSLLRNNYQDCFETEGILVLQGERQGTGKTTFCRILSCVDKTSPNKYFSGGRELNFGDKDTLRRCISNFIVELGELDNTMKQEQGKIKAFITQELDVFRVPYGRSDQKELRYTSLCATVNPKGYLLDPTGSRRFWTVPIDNVLGIDHELANSIDTLMLYKQVDVEAKANPRGYKLTREEQELLHRRNIHYDKPLKSEDEVKDILETCANDIKYKLTLMSVTAWQGQFEGLRKYSAEAIGKTLTKLGITTQIVKENGKTSRLRMLPRREGYTYHS